jgi:hypothetical protein
MAKSKKRKLEEGVFKILKQWEIEEPEQFNEGNNRTDVENTIGLLTFLLRTNKVKGVEI